MTQYKTKTSQPPSKNNLEKEEEYDYFDYFYDEPGSEPGTLSIDPEAEPSEIVLIDYTPERAIRKANLKPEECIPYLQTDSISWVDIQSLGSEEILRQIGEVFELHPLLLEDVVNVPQRPKIEEYGNLVMMIAHMVYPKANQAGFEVEQVGFVIGKKYLLTFQEEPSRDSFEHVRDRIRSNIGRVRQSGVDYLTYLLLDALIDGYFPVLEDYGERIEDLEDQVVLRPNREILEDIHEVRRQLLSLRRAIWPLRNVIDILIRQRTDLIDQEVQIYFRDCYDHVIQLLDIIETYRELASSLMDVYISSMSNKMTEVMNLLTIISTIFIPLTFIAGVYGMNFENMPELTWRWGYFICLGVMGAIALSLIFYFWRQGWFHRFYNPKED